MSSSFGPTNPYGSPSAGGYGQPPSTNLQDRVRGRVVAPAIALIVVGAIGLIASCFNVVLAFFPANVDPNAAEFIQEMQRNATGTQAIIIQGAFVFVNLAIIGGAAAMMTFKSWGLGLTATILAMVNCGTFCCLLGIPVGIWSLIILLQGDVKAAFDQRPPATYQPPPAKY